MWGFCAQPPTGSSHNPRMIRSKDALEVAAGVAVGYGAAKVLENVATKREAAANKREAQLRQLQEEILFPETYNGRPVGALEAEVIREMQEEAHLKKYGPPKKTYTAEDVKQVFDPPATAYPNALGKLSPELSAKLSAIASAPDLGAALQEARQISQLFGVASGREATVFELRLSRVDPDSIPNNWHKTYATSVQLVAERGVTRNHFRLQAVQHDALRRNNTLSRGDDIMAYDAAVKTDFVTGLISSKPASIEMLSKEMRGKLTPAVLAAALEKLLENGLPTRVDQPYYGA